MKKLAIFVLTLTLVLALVGCGKTEPEYLRVYSFNGENEQFTVSNGVIVLDDTKEIFYGGELKATDDFFVDTASCSATFYIMQGDEQKQNVMERNATLFGAVFSLNMEST